MDGRRWVFEEFPENVLIRFCIWRNERASPFLILSKISSSRNAVGGRDCMLQNEHSAWVSDLGEMLHEDIMAGSAKTKQPGNVEPPAMQIAAKNL